MERNYFDEDKVIVGYRRSRIKTTFTWIAIIATFGFLKLVFYWRPTWYLKSCLSKSNLKDCTFVFIMDKSKHKYVEKVCEMEPTMASRLSLEDPLMTNATCRYFFFKKMKYTWNENTYTFQEQRGIDVGLACSYFHTCTDLSYKKQVHRLFLFGKNKIEVKVTPVMKLMFTQVLNPFYVFQAFSIILWYCDEYEFYATTLLVISVASIGVQVYQTRAMQRALKKTVNEIGSVRVIRDGIEQEVSSEDLIPGDVLVITRHSGIMYCDAVITQGSCVVNESMLTGESVPVTKTPLPVNDPTHPTLDVKAHSRHVLFSGTSVIQVRSHPSSGVRAIVLRTGFSTAKGELVRAILFPKPSNFRFSQDAYKFMVVLFLLSILGIAYTFYIMVQYGFQLLRVLIRGLDLVTIVVPPALPAAMTVGIIFAQARLKKSDIFCISTNNINACGALNAVCFDKTGTLTEDCMDYWGVVPCYNGNFENLESNVQSFYGQDILYAMVSCHSLTLVDDKITGDPLEVKMFEATNWDILEQCYDESLFGINMCTILKAPPRPNASSGSDIIGVLRQFTFSSNLQRMSTIVQLPSQDSFMLYCKGSPEVLMTLCTAKSLPKDLDKTLRRYTELGYRVLGFAKRRLAVHPMQVLQIERSAAEADLTFLGLLIMENKMKKETTLTITMLKEANIRPIMVTGDNIQTAVSVGRKSKFVEGNDDIVLLEVNESKPQIICTKLENNNINQLDIDWRSSDHSCMVDSTNEPKTHIAINGDTWAYIYKNLPKEKEKVLVAGTIFARMLPEQKQQLVESLQEIGYYVGMCGDGANDCGALKSAHAGISLSECEASVASPFTSKIPDIRCVPKIICEGRAALVTSLGVFKYMATYSLTMFTSVCLLYWFGANLTGFGYLYIDLALITSLSITFGYTEAHSKISSKPPIFSLISLVPITSLLCHTLLNVSVLIFIWKHAQLQPWFQPYIADPDNHYSFETHIVTVIFCFSIFQYIILAVVFSSGPPYKRQFYTNKLFLVNVILCTVLSAVIGLFDIPYITDLVKLDLPPSFEYKLLIFGIACINFFMSMLLEKYVLESTLLRNLQQRMCVSIPTYVKIQNNWDPCRLFSHDGNVQMLT